MSLFYELVVDDCDQEHRRVFQTTQSAKDAWAATMLRKKGIFSAVLYRHEDGKVEREQEWERPQ